MSINIRQAQPGDAKAMVALRLAVRENVLTDPSRVTEDDVRRAVTETGGGWVAVEEGRLRGFSVALLEPPTIWALFVDPAFEGRGLGQRLLQEAVDWLWRMDADRIRLCTEPETRAARFYDLQGWRDVGENDRGETCFELRRPAAAG